MQAKNNNKKNHTHTVTKNQYIYAWTLKLENMHFFKYTENILSKSLQQIIVMDYMFMPPTAKIHMFKP